MTSIVRSESFVSAPRFSPLEQALENQQHRRAGQSIAAALEGDDTGLVRPVVQDVPHQVDVAALGDVFEDRPPDQVTAFARLRPLDPGSGSLDDLRLVEQDASQVRVGGEQAEQQGAITAAEIHSGGNVGEVVGRTEHARELASEGGHRRVEDRALIGPGRSIGPDVRSVPRAEADLPGAHAVQQ